MKFTFFTRKRPERDENTDGVLLPTEKEYHASTKFTEEEKQICDIIIKSDFSKCNISTSDWHYGGYGFSYFYYNNLKLTYQHAIRYGHKFNLSREDNGHFLKEISMGESKIKIIQKIIADKHKAYIEDSITSAFNNRKENAEDCPYCGTKNLKDKMNCINCGAVLIYKNPK